MRIIRLREVSQKTGLKASHLYALMLAKEFPQQVPLGPKAEGWDDAGA